MHPQSSTSLGERLVPALLVRDMAETLNFYEKLGFQVTGCHPQREQANWAELQRDGITLQFYTEPPHGTPFQPVCSGTFYLFPKCVDALAAEFCSKVTFAWGPELMDYGLFEFGIRDPNGYFFAFAEPR